MWAVFHFQRGHLLAHKIGVIGGDGIGPEVVAEALKVVRAAGVDLDTVALDLGGQRYLRTGEVLPDTELDQMRTLDAILLGAVGTPAGDLRQRPFDEVAASYPEVTTAYNHVDAACIHFVQDPGRYDVIVTDNLFGDILTDLGAAVAGGIGLAASANLNPARTGPSMFEPVHGSAPDIVGTGQANPLAAIRSAAMMLEFLGEADAAARVTKACQEAVDVAGTTSQIGDHVAERV